MTKKDSREEADRKRVLITGARGALGSVVCERFYHAGHDVIGVDIAAEKPGELSYEKGSGSVSWLSCDLTNATDISKQFEKIRAEIGPVDIVVHCAGGFRFAYADSVSDDDLDFLVDVNLRSTLLLLREVLPSMKQRNFGRIVLISSKSTLSPGAGEGPYAATKAGINALTEAVSREVQPYDITINAVLPSIINTEANRDAMPHGEFERWVPVESLSEIVFSLTQPFGNPINGALIPVMGRM